MAISRPILLALVAAILALVGFYATMGARTSGEESSAPANTVAEPAPTKPKADRTRPASPSTSPGRSATGPTRSAHPTATRDAGEGSRPGIPADVTRALARGRTVVLFFFQRGSADDAATAKAVAAVRRRAGVKVFEAPISRLADYRAVTAGSGISQAPAVLILRKATGAQTGGAAAGSGTGAARSSVGRASHPPVSARLVEGFVDPETLLQQVADAR